MRTLGVNVRISLTTAHLFMCVKVNQRYQSSLKLTTLKKTSIFIDM